MDRSLLTHPQARLDSAEAEGGNRPGLLEQPSLPSTGKPQGWTVVLGTSEDPKAPRGVHSLQQRSHSLLGSRAAVSQSEAKLLGRVPRVSRTGDSAQNEPRPSEASSLEKK